jgi:hippurate hydrolase
MQSLIVIVVRTFLCLSVGQASPAGAREIATRELSPDVLKAVDEKISASLPGWVDYYKSCHANPELSLQEKESADHIAKLFQAAGLKVTKNFGGYGVVGLLENGKGPRLLIRGDMDALPIIEETGLPFASKVKVKQPDGSTVGAMHACGHDVHQTVLVGTAQAMAAVKREWAGTIVFVAQPAEELGRGAEMMINAGLFDRFGKPDVCLAIHVNHEMEAGTVGACTGWTYANVDSIDITIYGRGGHGAYPHNAVDPIVTGAQVVMALQTIVSRRMNPREPSVITVGSFNAGTKHNIIPETAKLQLTVRSYTDEARALLLSSIKQITIDTCKAAGCPRAPDVVVLEEEYTPATYNDPQLTAKAAEVFRGLFGADRVSERPPTMGGEDFSRFSKTSGAPGLMFNIGVVDAKRFAAAKQDGAEPLPTVHSSKFQVDPEPTLKTGVRSMSALALSLLADR